MKVKTEFSSCEKTVFELVSRTCLQQVTFVFRREVWKRMNSAQFLTFSRKIKLINYPSQLQSSIVNLLFFQTLFSFSSGESRGFKKLKNGVLNSNSNIKAIRYPPRTIRLRPAQAGAHQRFWGVSNTRGLVAPCNAAIDASSLATSAAVTWT